MPQKPLSQRLKAALGALFDSTTPEARYQRPYERPALSKVTEEVNPTDRALMVSASRKLYANLGPVRGAVDGKALYSIGRSWLPKFTGKDKAFGDQARAWLLQEFYPLADIGGNDFQTALFLLSVGVDVEGDSAAMLTEYETGFPAIQLVPGLSIGNRKHRNGKPLEAGEYKGLTIQDGVVLNPQGRAVAYYVLGDKDDGSADQFISARDMILLKEPQFIGQVRGFPAFSSSLLDLQDFRTVQGYEKAAAMLASSIGLLEWNESGMVDMSDPKIGLGGNNINSDTVTREMLGGIVKVYKAGTGAKIEAFQNSRPGDAFERLRDHLIRSAMSGINWSYEMAWDFTKMGGAAARFEIAKCMRTVEDRQDLLKPFAKRAVGYAVAKASKLGILPKSDEWWMWDFTMPARMTADYGRDKAQDREDYINGIINLSDICAENGTDIDQHIKERAEENAKLLAAGLPLPMTPQQAQVAVAETQQQTATETQSHEQSSSSAAMAALESRHSQVIAALSSQPAPQVTITQPAITIQPPSVTVNTPEISLAAPVVNVEPAKVEMSAPQVTVNVPKQEQPVVNVAAPVVTLEPVVVPAPVVNIENNVTVPPVNAALVVKRDSRGLISGATIEDKKPETQA